MNWFVCNKENHWLEGEECRPATTFTTRQTKPLHDIRVLCDYIPFVEASRTLPVDFRTSRFRDPVRTGFRRVNQCCVQTSVMQFVEGFFLCFYHGKQLELAELSSAVTFVVRRDLLDVLDVIRRGA